MSQSKKILIALAAVVGVAALALLIGCGGKGSADEVRFQNVSDPGPKPFTPPADVPKGSSSSTSTSTSSSSSSGSSSGSSATDTNGSSGGSASQGKSSGASAQNTVCDREQLIAQLAPDPDKLSAFADVVGIDADKQTVADFIRKLRPVTLTRDTQVTNNFYSEGSAEAYQAILPKGTAVLADESGKPVARCRSGSPLAEPVKLEKQTKCVNCPANYQPPPPCEGKCFRPEPKAPPAKKVGEKVTIDPIAAYQACRSPKPVLEKLEGCKTEYEKARQVCAADPVNPGCDASVCLQQVVSPFTTACASYLENIDTGLDQQCAGKPTQAAKDACVAEARDERIRCAQVPTGPKCAVNPNFRFPELRKFCAMNPSRPDCKALQLGCAKDPSQAGCKALQDKCAAQPARPDCKVVIDLKLKCLGDKTRPECKGLPALPTARRQDEPGAGPEEGDPGAAPGAAGDGVDPGAGGDGGVPGPEAGPETTPPPENAPPSGSP
ncbi:MAG: hypothetical protein M3350_00490 [Actinomycetota bacterium]|nr:hypothetical protein [Actinomycetota bacterium]